MLHVDEKRNLFLKNQKISVVYFRAGYTPGEHT